MSTQSSRRLLTRLRHDLAELQDSPYPGVAVFTDDANFRKLCLVLTPPSGPWKGLALHFNVNLPEDWVRLPHFFSELSLADYFLCISLPFRPRCLQV